MQIRIGNGEVDVDVEATRKLYAACSQPAPEQCGCTYCRNWILQRDKVLPPAVLELFDRMGITPGDELEVYQCPTEDGRHCYGGWYVFVGRPVGKESIEGDFGGLKLSVEADPPFKTDWTPAEGTSALRFETEVDWVLDEPPEPLHESVPGSPPRGRAWLWLATTAAFVLSVWALWHFLWVGFVAPTLMGLVVGAILASAFGCVFRDPVRRQRAKTTLVILWFAFVVGWAYWHTRPAQMFKRTIGLTKPAGVDVLDHRYMGGIDPSCWLRMKTTPQAIETILASRPYEPVADASHVYFGFQPEWWHLDAFQDWPCYQWTDHQNGIVLWVNPDHTEAYLWTWST